MLLKLCKTKLGLKLLSNYAKLFKKSIILLGKKHSIYIYSNGSSVITTNYLEGDIRGHRSKQMYYYDDFELDEETFEELNKLFSENKKEE